MVFGKCTTIIMSILILCTNVIVIGNFYTKGDDMSIIKWHPFGDLEDLLEFRPTFGKNHHCDMYEQEGNIIVEMHVPGFDAEDIAVKIEDNRIYISGEQKHKKEVKAQEYYQKEIREGSFSHVLSLPCAVDEDAVDAKLHNGVLTITMPRAQEEEKEVKKIKVVSE